MPNHRPTDRLSGIAKRCLLIALLGLLGLSPAGAVTIVVNPASDDSSDRYGGTEARPVKTIARALALAKAGDTVRLYTGVYRESVIIDTSGTPQQPLRLEAAPGAHVVVTGADRLQAWRKEPAEAGENVYSTAWPHRFITWSETGTHPADDYHKMIGRAEQVFIGGYPLLQVLTRDKLSRGTFFVDLEDKRLYAQASNNEPLDGDGAQVEASVRETIWEVNGDYVETSGIIFRYAATPAQRGMVVLNGRGDVLQDCVVEWGNTIGAQFKNEAQTVRRCTFRNQGQLGLSGSHCHKLLLTECIVQQNNLKNFDRKWEAGGLKIVLARDVIFEKSRFINNRGHGIWFDIGNEDCTVRQSLIANNEDAGVFYEISFGLHLHDNVITGNGYFGNSGNWGANGGVSLSSSQDCMLERNLIVGNREGVQFREQDRTTPRIGREEPEVPIWTRGHVIRNNVIALNRDAQVWGWFDVNDERHWPRALQKVHAGRPLSARTNQATAEDSDSKPFDPGSLSLEELELSFTKNLFFGRPVRGVFVWGPDWRRTRAYPTLDEVKGELKFDSGAQLDSLTFSNLPAHDFRIPSNSPAFSQECYPPQL